MATTSILDMPVHDVQPTTPADPTIIVVSGFGRCGTSLLMQMLAAAGIPCTGRSPAFEEKPPEAHRADAAFWVRHYGGKAIKVLDPQINRLPAGPKYRAIWMDRNPHQQARSQMKLLLAMGYKVAAPEKVAIKKFEKVNRAERPRATAALRTMVGEANCFNLTFEHLVAAPHIAASQVWDIFGSLSRRQGENREQVILDMGSVVKWRHSDCYPGIMEMKLEGFEAVMA